MTIVEFLAARLDEDEAVAQAASHYVLREKWHAVEWYNGEFESGQTAQVDIHGLAGAPITARGALRRVDGVHIARHDPARVLREVAAKRRTLARHFADNDGSCVGCHFDSQEERWAEDINDCPELRDMASIYADHLDYDPAWTMTT